MHVIRTIDTKLRVAFLPESCGGEAKKLQQLAGPMLYDSLLQALLKDDQVVKSFVEPLYKFAKGMDFNDEYTLGVVARFLTFLIEHVCYVLFTSSVLKKCFNYYSVPNKAAFRDGVAGKCVRDQSFCFACNDLVFSCAHSAGFQ